MWNTSNWIGNRKLVTEAYLNNGCSNLEGPHCLPRGLGFGASADKLSS